MDQQQVPGACDLKSRTQFPTMVCGLCEFMIIHGRKAVDTNFNSVLSELHSQVQQYICLDNTNNTALPLCLNCTASADICQIPINIVSATSTA